MRSDNNTTTTIRITRLNGLIYPDRDSAILALDSVYHLIGQFILADYRNEWGRVDTIVAIGRLNGTGKLAYSVISTAGEFIINKIDLADVSEVVHGEVHLARLRYPDPSDPPDWFMVTIGQENQRIIEPIDRSRIFKNLDDNYRWFYIKETRVLKREDDFYPIYEYEGSLELIMNMINKPTMTISYENHPGDDFYIEQLNTTLVNPILDISVVDYTGLDITADCVIKINNSAVIHESGDVHKYKYTSTFNTDREITVSYTYLGEITLERTVRFYFPYLAYYGTCSVVNGNVNINNDILGKKIYSNLTSVDLLYTLNRNRSILIIPQNFTRFDHIFDVHGLDYYKDYTYEANFSYNGETYSAYYKNDSVVINDFKQEFTY